MSRPCWERILLALELLSVIGAIIVAVGLWMEGWRALDEELVVIGVGIEAFVAVWILVASRTLQAIQERELEEMRLETAQANARAAEADARATEANVELWKLKAPRTVPDSERELLVSMLRAIDNKCRVDIYALIPHDEIRGLQSQLLSVFNQAGWDVRTNANLRIPQPGIVNGLIVEVNAGASPQMLITANAIASALRKVSLETVGPQASYTMRDAPIEILVGPKP